LNEFRNFYNRAGTKPIYGIISQFLPIWRWCFLPGKRWQNQSCRFGTIALQRGIGNVQGWALRKMVCAAAFLGENIGAASLTQGKSF